MGFSMSFLNYRFLSMLNYLNLTVYLLFIIVQIIIFFKYLKNININEIYYVKNFDETGEFNVWFRRLLGIFLLPFLNQFYFMNISKYLKFEGYKFNLLVISRSYLFPIFFIVTITFFGYLSFGEMTPKIILFSPKKCVYYEVIISINIVRLLYMMVLLNLIAL